MVSLNGVRTLLNEAGPLHAELSQVHREFLEFIACNPEGLVRSHFAALDQGDGVYEYPLQAWPTFVDAGKRRLMESVSVGLCSLIKSLPERCFGSAPEKLAAFYGIPPWTAEDLVRALCHTGAADSVIARGDFIDTPRGFQCLEFNICGNLGGWQTAVWTERFRRVPLIERFRATLSIPLREQDTLRSFLTHAVRVMAEREGHGGVLNLGVLAAPWFQGADLMESFLNQQYLGVLGRFASEARGRIVLCDYSDLSVRDGGLWLGRTRLHGLVEQYDQPFSREISGCFARGEASFFNGPLRLILDDKRNLALLSASQSSEELFDEEERALLSSVLPWTRQIATGEVLFEGEAVFLPDLLSRRREDLVLKQAKAYAGQGVWLGCATPPAEWEDLVRRALAAGDWVVQRRVDSRPYLYQTSPEGCAPHDVIWGLFVFGAAYGGCFLRMQPRDRRAIINSGQGATEGMVFEVES
jgi:hypothetical protein